MTSVVRARRACRPGALVLLVALMSRSAVAGAACPGDAGCCSSVAQCDDEDTCTVDLCTSGMCEHASLDLATVLGEARGLLPDGACADVLPKGLERGVGRALRLLTRASGRGTTRAARLVARAARRLEDAGEQIASAAARGRIGAGCAADLGGRIDDARGQALCLVPGGGTARSFACLGGGGPLVHLTGTRGDAYRPRTLAAETRIDARGAVFVASPSNRYPIVLDEGPGVCLAGGDVRGEYDRSLGWAAMHDLNNAGVAFASPTTVDGIRIDDVTDGIRPRGVGPFAIRAAWLSYVRDDCVENDHLEGGLIDDVLFDGCYVALSERPSPDSTLDGHENLVTIRRSLIRLEAMPGPRDGSPSDLGHGQFFKWSDAATRLALYDDVFFAERVSQSGAESMGVPETLVDCARNVMVWLGPGAYPAPLPPCFTVTTNRAVWDQAVTRWKARHPAVGAR